MKKNIIVIVAHTDDEALGCGGTIAKHVDQGDYVYTVFLADGVSSRNGSNSRDIDIRKKAADKAQKTLGIKESFYFNFPDNKMDTIPLLQVVKKLEDIIDYIKPEIIYTHHYGDLNIDHQVIFKSVMTACRPLPNSTIKEIYSFEIPSATDFTFTQIHPFLPNVFVDITDYFHIKKQALIDYSIEMRKTPHSRSLNNISNLAKNRGNSNGLIMAEAFCALRIIK